MAVIDSESKLADADFEHQFVDDQGRFYIGNNAGGADGVEIALYEFAEPAFLGAFAAPDRGDVIPLERGSNFMKVFGGKASEGDRQVEPHADGPSAVVFEVIHLPVGLIGAFTGEDFEVFEGGGVDGGETESAVDGAGDVHQSLALSHGWWKEIAESFECSGFDKCHDYSSGWF